jgi:hypothetical protein
LSATRLQQLTAVQRAALDGFRRAADAAAAQHSAMRALQIAHEHQRRQLLQMQLIQTQLAERRHEEADMLAAETEAHQRAEQRRAAAAASYKAKRKAKPNERTKRRRAAAHLRELLAAIDDELHVALQRAAPTADIAGFHYYQQQRLAATCRERLCATELRLVETEFAALLTAHAREYALRAAQLDERRDMLRALRQEELEVQRILVFF